MGNLALLLVAGFETTTNLIGNGVHLLLERPEHQARLAAEPQTAPAYVEEILRYDSPVQLTERFAGVDTELGGVRVPRGAELIVLLGAANQDPERFAAAFRPTAETVEVGLSPMEMANYLDYCSELLSLVAKTAAVYAERSTDGAVLATISDIENLTNGMARKIWQKLGLVPGVGPKPTGPAD